MEFKTFFDVGDYAYIIHENQIIKVVVDSINIKKQRFDSIISSTTITYVVKSVGSHISFLTEIQEKALFETPEKLFDALLRSFENKNKF
jgi:hypothetical protein